MLHQPTRGLWLRFLGVCVLLLAVLFIFIPKKYQLNLGRLFYSGDNSDNEKLRATRMRGSADSRRKNKARFPRRDAKEWFAEVCARNPELEPKWRSVPDHENGFLLWVEFCESYKDPESGNYKNLNLPPDIAEMLSNPDKWDSEVMKTFLDANKDLVETISRIGLLPSHSAAGIDVDRWSFMPGMLIKQSAELLLADARLAAESGDLDKALRQVKAASGLASHYDQIEAPTLQLATMSIITRLKVQEQAMNHFLPALKGNPDEIARWRETIRSPNMEPSAFAALLQGEGWVSLGGLVIPWVNGDISDHSFPSAANIPDPDALFDNYAQSYIEAAKKSQTSSLDELLSGEYDYARLPIAENHLSEEAKKLFEECSFAASIWAKGWIRSVALSGRTDAAFAVMLGEEIPLEPYTGLPYIYDPVARTVQVPFDPKLRENLSIGDPLKLP